MQGGYGGADPDILEGVRPKPSPTRGAAPGGGGGAWGDLGGGAGGLYGAASKKPAGYDLTDVQLGQDLLPGLDF